jgi:Tol biopolymer transport system component
LPSGNQILYAVAGQGLWTVSPLGGTPTRVIERGSNPNVSRDGSRLVYEDQRAIWTAAPDGSNVQQVKGVPIPLYNLPMTPALSPDGRSIAYFSAELGPNGDFWTIPVDGGTPTRLTSDLREGGWPVWTPDGRSIVVSSARAGSRTLWQLAIDGWRAYRADDRRR